MVQFDINNYMQQAKQLLIKHRPVRGDTQTIDIVGADSGLVAAAILAVAHTYHPDDYCDSDVKIQPVFNGEGNHQTRSSTTVIIITPLLLMMQRALGVKREQSPYPMKRRGFNPIERKLGPKYANQLFAENLRRSQQKNSEDGASSF